MPLQQLKRASLMEKVTPYIPANKVRIVTAASLFDGHDAAINIMRRIIQSTGCEVIHLGHDRSVEEVVNCAIQEDVQAIADAVSGQQADLDELLANSSLFQGDVSITNEATLQAFKNIGSGILY